MLTILDLPISVTLRFAGLFGDRKGIVAGKILRVLDDSTVEVKVAGSTIKAEWNTTHEAYMWAGRTLWVSNSFSALDDKLVPRIAAPIKDSIEGFLAWCAAQDLLMAHIVLEPSPKGMMQKLYRLSELTTGSQAEVIAKYRESTK